MANKLCSHTHTHIHTHRRQSPQWQAAVSAVCFPASTLTERYMVLRKFAHEFDHTRWRIENARVCVHTEHTIKSGDKRIREKRYLLPLPLPYSTRKSEAKFGDRVTASGSKYAVVLMELVMKLSRIMN